MLSLAEIIERLKTLKLLSKDKEIAELLKLDPKAFATAKSRDSIPYDKLITFCNQEGISLNWLLADVGPIFLGKEEAPPQEDQRLAGLIEKLETIYREGDFDERVRLRGTLEELYDSISEKKKQLLREDQKKGA